MNMTQTTAQKEASPSKWLLGEARLQVFKEPLAYDEEINSETTIFYFMKAWNEFHCLIKTRTS